MIISTEIYDDMHQADKLCNLENSTSLSYLKILISTVDIYNKGTSQSENVQDMVLEYDRHQLDRDTQHMIVLRAIIDIHLPPTYIFIA